MHNEPSSNADGRNFRGLNAMTRVNNTNRGGTVKRRKMVAVLAAMALVLQLTGVAAATNPSIPTGAGIGNPGPFSFTKTFVEHTSPNGNVNILPDSSTMTMNGGTLNADGTFTVPVSISGPNLPLGTGSNQGYVSVSAMTGSINPATGEVTASLFVRYRVRMSNASIFGSARDCDFEYTANLTTGTAGSRTGVPYDQTTGTMTLVAAPFQESPGTGLGSNCNGGTRDTLNNQLGRPGTGAMTLALAMVPPAAAAGVQVEQTPKTLTEAQTGVPTANTLEWRVFSATDVAEDLPVGVTSTLPGSLVPTSASGSGWDCSIDGQDVTCTTNDGLAAGESYPSISVVVDAGSVFPSADVAVTVSTPDNVAGGGTSTLTYPVATPGIGVSVVAGASGQFTFGKPNDTFTLNATNTGASVTVSPIVVTGTLPAELEFQSVAGTGWVCSADGQDVTCTFADSLAAGSTTPDVVIEVEPTVESGDFTFTVTAATDRTDGAQDAAEVTVGSIALDIDAVSNPTIFTVGQDAAYKVTVNNTGSRPTFDSTTVVAALPSSVDFISASGTGWSCSAVSISGRDIVTCGRGGAIAAGGSAPDITIAVDVPALPSPAFIDLDASVSTATSSDGRIFTTEVREPLPDMTITKTSDEEFVVGATGTYTISTENIGTGATFGPVTVLDTLPSSFTFESVSATGWTCTTTPVGNTRVLSCTRSAILPAGEALPDIVVTGTVTSAAFPSVSNTATVSTQSDPFPQNNTSTVTTPVAANFLVVATEPTDDFVALTDGDVTSTVTNTGDAPTDSAITLVQSFDETLEPSAGSGDGWVCAAPVDNTITCEFDDVIAPHDSAPVVTFTTGVTTDAVPSASTSVSVTTANTVPAGAATDSATITVLTNDLAITKQDVGAFQLSLDGGYTIDVENVGNAATIDDITVTDQLPAPLTFVSFGDTDETWTCSATSGGLLTCVTNVELAPGDSLPTIEVEVEVGTGSGPIEVTNTATVETDGDVNPDNDSSSVTTQLVTNDLAVSATFEGPLDGDLSSDLVIGKPATLTLDVENIGSAPTLDDVSVLNTLPEGVTVANFDDLSASWMCEARDLAGKPGFICMTASGVTIADGDSLPIAVNLNVGGGTPGGINDARVDTPFDGDPSNNEEKLAVTINPPQSQLALSLTGDPLYTLDDPGVLGFTVTNNGLGATTTTTVVIELPAGVTFQTVVLVGPDDWECASEPADDDASLVTCTTSEAIGAEGGELSGAIGIVVDPTVSDTEVAATASSANQIGQDAEATISLAVAVNSLTLTKTADPSFTVGLPGTFTIAVTNDGNGATTGDITVTDTLPEGTTFVSFDGTNEAWECEDDGADLTCVTPGPLATDASLPDIVVNVDVDMDGLPSVTNTATVDSANNTGGEASTDSVTVDVLTNDVTITKDVVNPESVNLGEPATFTLTVGNLGDAATVGDVVVTDSLPAGLEYVSATGDGWTCTEDAGEITCDLDGSVAPGATSVITVVVNVGEDAWPEATNTAEVTTDFDSNLDNNTDSATVNPTRPDLGIEVIANGPFVVDNIVSFTINVANNGSGATTGPIVVEGGYTEALEGGFVDGSDWTCEATMLVGGNGFRCETPGPLAAGGSLPAIAVTATATVDSFPTASLDASVTTAFDLDEGTKEASASLDIDAPDLEVEKSHVGYFTPGQINEYLITVTNVGTAPMVDSLEVRDVLPMGIGYLSSSSTQSGWNCLPVEAAGQVFVDCTNPVALTPGQSIDLTIVVSVGFAALPAVTNVVEVSTPGDPNSDNDRAEDFTVVNLPGPNLSVTKAASGNFIVNDLANTFTYTVSNDGLGRTLGRVQLLDNLADGVTVAAASGTGWNCEVPADLVACQYIPSLVPGATTPALTVTLSVTETAIPGFDSDVVVDVAGELDPESNTASAAVEIDYVELELTKQSQLEQVSPGQQVSYDLTVSNVGTTATTGPVSVLDVLPATLTSGTGSGAGWLCFTQSLGTASAVSCTRGATLAPSESATVTLTATVAQSATGEITNTARASSPASINEPEASSTITVTQSMSQAMSASLTPVPATGVPTAGFTDVRATSQAASAINWMAFQGLTTGVNGSARFSPGDVLNRAQLVTFLWRAYGEPVASTNCGFRDVNSGSYFAQAACWAKAQGIVTGIGGNGSRFAPAQLVTRAQMALMLHRAEPNLQPESSCDVADVPPSGPLASAVCSLVDAGIITGVGGDRTRFAPGGQVTRAQISSVLYRIGQLANPS